MIYEAGEQQQQSSADHSNVAFEPQTNSSTTANNQDKLSSEANDIPLTDEDLLQRIHNDENSDAAIAGSDAPSLLVYTGDGIPVSSSTIIDASKLYGPGTVTIADFAQSQSVTYMASILSQNEPEDLTGNRRGSNHQEENNDGLQ